MIIKKKAIITIKKNNLQINLTSNIEDELNKFNNNVNDIEVIDIKRRR